jgi:hypothetical protein
MKFNFRKISAILSTVVMVGSTLGLAAAANYPAPFISGSSASVAIVYGTGSGVATSDAIEAGNIQTDLQSRITSTGGTSTVSGGDSFEFARPSTKFDIGQGIKDIVSVPITNDQLPTLLADGKFVDANNDEFEYTQKIDMNNLSLTMFSDSDYNDKEPTIGIRIPSATNVLNYTLDFSDMPEWTDLATATLPLMGKSYYILSTNTPTNTTMTLLDSATDATINEGETLTLNVDGTTYDVSIAFVGQTEVKMNVNGETTNTLNEGETSKLSDGSFIGIKDILYNAKDTGISSVDFSIGKGKLKLTSGSDIEINDDSVSGISANFTSSSGKLDKIVITWEADDDLFVTTESSVTMPGFEAVKLSYGGEVYPAQEKITVEDNGEAWQLSDFPLKDSTEDIDLLHTNGTAIDAIGKDTSSSILRTVGTGNLTFNGDTDAYFIASWTDNRDAESYLMRATNFKVDNGVNKTTLQYKSNNEWKDAKVDAQKGDTFSIGNVQLTVSTINKNSKTVNIGPGSSVNFHILYSKEGLRVYLPYAATNTTTAAGAINLTLASQTGSATGHNMASFYLNMTEEDKNEVIGGGKTIILTLDESGGDPSVSAIGVGGISGYSVTPVEIDDSNVYRTIVYSPLATEILWDKPSGDPNTVELTYHGGESYGQVYITAPNAQVSSGGGASQLGDILVTDAEVSSVSTKNLIIVGGSCINSAAAHVLGGSYCGAAFTEATGVGSGEFLIKGVSGAYTSGKIALVVAGYNAVDTVNAATYLRTQTVDTSKEYKGTSSTMATLVGEETA